MKQRLSINVAAAALACVVAAVCVPPAGAQAPKPVVLRFVADFTRAAASGGHGDEVLRRAPAAGDPGQRGAPLLLGRALHDPEAFEAMRQGNLEMTWMQMGKAAPVDPLMMSVVGPGVLTTVGAVDNFEKTKTYQTLVERLQKKQAIKVFGAAHMSFGMGVGGKKRYLKPEDFTGRKVRSMGPAENPVLESWKANPVVMAFGEVPTAMRVGRDRRPDDQHRRLARRARAGALLHDRRRRRVHRRLLHDQREPALVGPAHSGARKRRCEGLVARDHPAGEGARTGASTS